MAAKSKNELNVRVKDADPFYSNDIAINVSPTEFVFDFKCLTQLQDIGNHGALVVKHNPIIITPLHAKKTFEMLGKAIKDFEKRFGKIEKSKAIKKAEKIVEKKSKKDKKAIEVTKPETYFG